MSFEPKPISRESVPAALQKAERYRIINDPSLRGKHLPGRADGGPGEPAGAGDTAARHHRSISRRAHRGGAPARQILARLGDEYKRAYYAGIICERCAKAQMRPLAPGLGQNAYHWLREAMSWYEKAEKQRPARNDEAILRWNTCARILARHPELQPSSEEPVILSLE